MLLELKIKNFVIIDELDINFGQGLNILTGETGAGKSILIGALSGVLGEKMTTDSIRTGYERASLEGHFDVSGLPTVKKMLNEALVDYDDDVVILRRELYASGRGKCFLGATQVPVAKMKEVAEYLVDIHGQNEQQNISKVVKHRELLDSFGKNENLVFEMRQIHEELNQIKDKLESFQIDEREKARRIEFNSFAIKEINAADLKENEEEELKNESTLLSNSEKLFKEINNSSLKMNGDVGVITGLRQIEQSLSTVSEYDTEISDILETVKEALYSLEDSALFLRGYEENINFSPERINEVEERLSLISSFKKKYGDTVKDVLQYRDKIEKELEAISSNEDELDKLKKLYTDKLILAKDMALELSIKRQAAAKILEDKVMKELNDLGMGGTRFKVSIKREISEKGEIESDNKKYILYPHGLDRIEFLIAANEGEELRQLRKVASGGEMSRLMLALKNVILSADTVDSLIFDEVDTGISGKTAEIVGKKLKFLSKDRQVLVITHLPQIAAMSDFHFSVQKGKQDDRITTVVKPLGKNEKVKEVARMLAGENITELSLKHAEEMIG